MKNNKMLIGVSIVVSVLLAVIVVIFLSGYIHSKQVETSNEKYESFAVAQPETEVEVEETTAESMEETESETELETAVEVNNESAELDVAINRLYNSDETYITDSDEYTREWHTTIPDEVMSELSDAKKLEWTTDENCHDWYYTTVPFYKDWETYTAVENEWDGRLLHWNISWLDKDGLYNMAQYQLDQAVVQQLPGMALPYAAFSFGQDSVYIIDAKDHIWRVHCEL